MSRKRRNESSAIEQPPVFRRSAAGIPLFSPGPKGRIITAKMVQDAEDNEGVEEALEQMELARKFMQENRDVLSKLAGGSDEPKAK
jgi:hypothetical protein